MRQLPKHPLPPPEQPTNTIPSSIPSSSNTSSSYFYSYTNSNNVMKRGEEEFHQQQRNPNRLYNKNNNHHYNKCLTTCYKYTNSRKVTAIWYIPCLALVAVVTLIWASSPFRLWSGVKSTKYSGSIVRSNSNIKLTSSSSWWWPFQSFSSGSSGGSQVLTDEDLLVFRQRQIRNNQDISGSTTTGTVNTLQPPPLFSSSSSSSSSSTSQEQQQHEEEARWERLEMGQIGTHGYRVWTLDTITETPSSFWHDISLYPPSSPPIAKRVMEGKVKAVEEDEEDDDNKPLKVVQFVCEIPRGSRAKFEIQKEARLNPIAQDRKIQKKEKAKKTMKSSSTSSSSKQDDELSFFTTTTPNNNNIEPPELRYYMWDSLVNYGALPRTYEHPELTDLSTHRKGDGDPLDAVDICPFPCQLPGEVYPMYVLGSLAMVDGSSNEDRSLAADWKILGIRKGCFTKRVPIEGEEKKKESEVEVDEIQTLFPKGLSSLMPTISLEKEEDEEERDGRIKEGKESPSSILVSSKSSSSSTSSLLSTWKTVLPFTYNPVRGPESLLSPELNAEMQRLLRTLIADDAQEGEKTEESLRGSSSSTSVSRFSPSQVQIIRDWTKATIYALQLWLRDYKLKVEGVVGDEAKVEDEQHDKRSFSSLSSSTTTATTISTTNVPPVSYTGEQNTFDFQGSIIDAHSTTSKIIPSAHGAWCAFMVQLAAVEAGVTDVLLYHQLESLRTESERIEGGGKTNDLHSKKNSNDNNDKQQNKKEVVDISSVVSRMKSVLDDTQSNNQQQQQRKRKATTKTTTTAPFVDLLHLQSSINALRNKHAIETSGVSPHADDYLWANAFIERQEEEGKKTKSTSSSASSSSASFLASTDQVARLRKTMKYVTSCDDTLPPLIREKVYSEAGVGWWLRL